MQYSSFCVFLYLVQLITLCLSECTERCKSTLIYENLKCKPIYAKEGDCCPIKYDCSHIDNRPANKCHFQGVFYDVGTHLDNNLVGQICSLNCRCNERTEYSCDKYTCPHWSGIDKPHCYLKYDLRKCCPIGENCGDDVSVTCQVGDVIYKEGETFDVTNGDCLKCVCQKGFKGKFEKPFCIKQLCNHEINYARSIHQNCAPAYISPDNCCPLHWVCHEETDVIQVSATPHNSHLQCKFGNKILNIGDRMERKDEFADVIKCECVIPPLLTCLLDF